WISEIIVNKVTGHIIDGHLRVTLAMRKGAKVPVKYVDLSIEEEKLALASYDFITGEAVVDEKMMRLILSEVEEEYPDMMLISDIEGSMIEPTNEVLMNTGILQARFLVPPFSVLDCRQGYWRNRKKEWLSLGIQSEVGRGPKSIEYDKDIAPSENAYNHEDGLIYHSDSGRDPRYYEMKRATELKLGREISTEEFQTYYYKPGSSLSGSSIFDPVLAEISYKWYCPPGGKILDPFAGGSVRGIVAAYLGYEYHGNDLSARQIAANRLQAESCPTGRSEIARISMKFFQASTTISFPAHHTLIWKSTLSKMESFPR
ncbi:MAG: hypothetical protein JRD89_15600, partial [Deltaproteobacteria bacterium]|nr:hypothetical protein [Deltaproteobacteria bacterium]